jgi:hypothetical protein
VGRIHKDADVLNSFHFKQNATLCPCSKGLKGDVRKDRAAANAPLMINNHIVHLAEVVADRHAEGGIPASRISWDVIAAL